MYCVRCGEKAAPSVNLCSACCGAGASFSITVSAQSAQIIHAISMDAPIWLFCVIGRTLGGIESHLTRPFAMLVGQTSIWDSHYGYGGATRAWPGSRSDCPEIGRAHV